MHLDGSIEAQLSCSDPAPHDGYYALYELPSAFGPAWDIYPVVTDGNEHPSLGEVADFLRHPQNSRLGNSLFHEAAWFTRGQIMWAEFGHPVG